MSIIEYTCNCGCHFGDYSDHAQNCPIWMAGRINSLEEHQHDASVTLLDVKQQLCKARERAYHWERCYIIKEGV